MVKSEDRSDEECNDEVMKPDCLKTEERVMKRQRNEREMWETERPSGR